MFSIDLKSITLSLLVSIAWYFGAIELFRVFTDFGNNWYWYVLAVFYTVTINELFAHLICTHNLFPVNTNSWTYKILTFLVSVDHGYGLRDLVRTHQSHHIYPDQGDRDIYDFKRHWSTVCSMSPLMFLYQKKTNYPNSEKYLDKQNSIHRNILNDDWTFFCEEFKIPLTLLYWTALYLFLPLMLFKVVFMGRIIISIMNILLTTMCHTRTFGYRNFNLQNDSSNNLFLHYVIGLGMSSSLLHNNHHSKFWLKAETHSNKWYEIDIGSYIIKLLKIGLK